MNKLIIIAAVGKNNELGKDNDLIWHFKKDLTFFKNTTMNHHIVMGKNTFFSLPKMLPQRKHIVLTTSDISLPKEVIVCKDMKDFKDYAYTTYDDIYVIGGATVYKQFMDMADEMILTHINDSCLDASVYFPEIVKDDWEEEIIDDFSPKYLRKVYKKNNL